MNHYIKILAGIILLACSQTAPAANFYRCGSSYQDTPCAGTSVNNKTIKSSAKTTSNTTDNDKLQPFQIDVDCKQRGESAKKIMWTREVGKTLEQQLETAQDVALVKDVYNHRGSALEVKNAIEQECMQQKEQDKLADKLLIEAQKLRGKKSAGIENTMNSNNPTSADTKSGKLDEANASPVNNKTKCSELKSAAEDIARLRRRGGSGEYMDKLKQDREKIESQTELLGC